MRGFTPARRLRLWSAAHTWSSLACTAFLLLCCLTGLPLIFADEIAALQEDLPPAVAVPDPAAADPDRMLAQARLLYPGQVIDFVVRDDDAPVVNIGLRPGADASPSSTHRLRFDARDGKLLKRIPAADSGRLDAMALIRQLHATLLGGFAGGLALAAVALLFLVALASGVALYAPFARKQAFGAIRRSSPRVRWLDLHNLLGMATLVWACVVGATGLFNELSRPLFALWSQENLKSMAAAHGASAATAQRYPLAAAIAAVESALPGTRVGTILMPGSRLAPPGHYLLWAAGDTPLTAHLLQPVLVDAGDGHIAGIARMPWYLRALELSRPLHFGDYGGLPLKLLWAALDLAAIAVLASGLLLWISRRRRRHG
ncbi:PepSY domain-containing protein [Herbaspirillum sp. WKF16]|uniref:PepSY-associated TM helix domain-containing protein n=1 Tax=Herbaspirillum sp. WKF16 TaxID=3028312 RepID=UPI0023A9574B|nr:PepSY domain-containing protein [Herbaspirillum sp. WKF16]WDZ94712.1 PepSY domain-containing protein [Herbaspirillum sp. WKF16]